MNLEFKNDILYLYKGNEELSGTDIQVSELVNGEYKIYIYLHLLENKEIKLVVDLTNIYAEVVFTKIKEIELRELEYKDFNSIYSNFIRDVKEELYTHIASIRSLYNQLGNKL